MQLLSEVSTGALGEGDFHGQGRSSWAEKRTLVYNQAKRERLGSGESADRGGAVGLTKLSRGRAGNG